MGKVALVLKAFENATKIAEAEDCCVSKVIPIVKKLRLELRQAYNVPGIGTLQDTITTNMKM